MGRLTSYETDQVTIQAGRLKAAGSAALIGTLMGLIFYAGVAFNQFRSMSDRQTADEAILSKLAEIQQQQGQTQAQLVQGMGDLKDEVHTIAEQLK